MHTFDMPAAGIRGDQLEAELDAAGVPGAVSVTVDGEVAVHNDADRAAVQAVVDAHAPAPIGHVPLNEAGRIVTLLAVRQVKDGETGEIIPLVELANVVGAEPEDLTNEFYAWLAAGNA